MSSSVKNDHKEQLFYDPAMIRNRGAQTLLLGVLDSKSFADSDIDYYVGQGGLAGVIGAPSAPAAGMKSYANDRWSMLREKLDLEEAIHGEIKPVFCWIDPVRPRVEEVANDEKWLQIDDVVGPLGSGADPHKSLYPGVPRAGWAILSKICGALARMDYPSDVISKVGGLVERNMMTVVHCDGLLLETESSPEHEKSIETRMQALLVTMLASNTSRTRSVHMNSNEPVLLINNFAGLRHEQLRDIVRIALDQLQQNYNIWPVRVYAGQFMMGDVGDEYRQNGFSVTLLNVVNTEIGGPSMIDLLDQACEAPIWSYGLGSFFKEVWRDRQLIDKFETTAVPSRSSSSASIAQQSEASLMSEVSVTKQSSSLARAGMKSPLRVFSRKSRIRVKVAALIQRG